MFKKKIRVVPDCELSLGALLSNIFYENSTGYPVGYFLVPDQDRISGKGNVSGKPDIRHNSKKN